MDVLGQSVLPGVKKLKAEYLGITGNTVADWMKDLQVDATAMPGKAFDVSFEMPEADVGHHDVQPLRRGRPVGGEWAGRTSWRRTATPRARSR